MGREQQPSPYNSLHAALFHSFHCLPIGGPAQEDPEATGRRRPGILKPVPERLSVGAHPGPDVN